MATYAEVVNNNGKIVIDDTTGRLCRTRTLHLAAGYGTWEYAYIYGINMDDYAINGFSIYDVQLNSNEKFIAVRAKQGHDNVAVFVSAMSGNLFRVYLIGTWSDPNTHADDYLIDVYGTDPNRSYNSGLQIFNASANKIFDSNEYFMNVVGTYSYDTSSLSIKTLQTELPKTLSIGSGMSVEYNSVVIGGNTRLFARSGSRPEPNYQSLYGVNFGSNGVIKLIMRCSTLILSWPGRLPPTFSACNMGVFLNHENMPERNDGTLS